MQFSPAPQALQHCCQGTLKTEQVKNNQLSCSFIYPEKNCSVTTQKFTEIRGGSRIFIEGDMITIFTLSEDEPSVTCPISKSEVSSIRVETCDKISSGIEGSAKCTFWKKVDNTPQVSLKAVNWKMTKNVSTHCKSVKERLHWWDETTFHKFEDINVLIPVIIWNIPVDCLSCKFCNSILHISRHDP